MTTLSNATRQHVTVDGLQTFFLRQGNGAPVVLVHGGAPGACAEVNWGANIEALAKAGFTIYAFDQPGFGLTDNPEDYSMEYRVRHAQAFIDSLGLDRYLLMGNSQGSYIAARIALSDPRVEKLVLVSSGTLSPAGSGEAQRQAQAHSDDLAGYEPGLENMRKLTQGTFHRPEMVTEELVRLRYEMSTGPRHEAMLARRGTPRPRPIVEELRSLNVRTLIVGGLHDHGVAVERTMALFQLLPDAELHLFTHSGHWVQRDQADRFNTLVSDFLNGA